MTHLLVTNDFPPKVGGIQSYLWELWRRLPAERVVVLTTPHRQAPAFDAAQPFSIIRTRLPVLLPTPGVVRRIRTVARESGASLVVLDPALPLGLIGPSVGLPYAVILHGAEVTVPGRLPVGRALLRSVLAGASHVISAGTYPADEARRAAGGRLPPVTVVPPGVDPDRFQPLDDDERAKARADFGLPPDTPVVVSVSRLVPRKGMDVLIKASAQLAASGDPDLLLAIGGTGRDRRRLERIAIGAGAPVRFLGRVPDGDLARLLGCADVFAMICRSRWAGLEQEGFGIVFVEAAACGVAQVAGASGGAAEAVVHDKTGLVVEHPTDVDAVADAIGRLLADPERRAALGRRARRRAVEELDYTSLAARLDVTLQALESPKADL